MIPQLVATPVAGPAAKLAAGEPSNLDSDSSPLASIFGDLLSAMTSADAAPQGLSEALSQELAQELTQELAQDLSGLDVAIPQEEGAPEALSASILELLASLEPDGALALQLRPGEGASDPINDIQQWLLQNRPATDGVVTDAELLAEDAARLPPALAAGVESRLAGSEPVMLASASAIGNSALGANTAPPPGLLDALQSLATAGQQPAGTDAQGSSTLAAALQASAPERQLEITAGRLPQPGPLPPQELRATVSQTLEQVAWMSREGVHQARLQLEPAHLGRVDIWLDLEGSEARLHLGAQQAQVREALEAVLPRLREALAEHGMSLTDASVSHSGRDDASGESGRGDAAGASTAFADDAATSEQADSGLPGMSDSGLLDIYA
ncbi:MAG: flagellar hook-length control protein FliK [Chromatocurvus sp.]